MACDLLYQFSMHVTIHEHLKFRPGDVVDMEDEGHMIVLRVNECRTVLSSVNARQVSFTEGQTERKVSFQSVGSRTVSISSTAEVPILRRLGKAGLDYWREHKRIPTA